MNNESRPSGGISVTTVLVVVLFVVWITVLSAAVASGSETARGVTFLIVMATWLLPGLVVLGVYGMRRHGILSRGITLGELITIVIVMLVVSLVVFPALTQSGR